MNTNLAKQMVSLADKDLLPADHVMRIRADDFDKACEGYFSTPQTVMIKSFLGAYARARRTWCDYTGDTLV